ncbi:MAG: hypothetical protein WB609_03580 [Candidatus Cybelea sp.]
MNRSVILAFALAIALIGPASAGTFYRYVPTTESPKIAAGIIFGNGEIERGSGFTVQHPETGVYHITFTAGFFPTGCASIVAQSFAHKSYKQILTQASVTNCAGRNPIFHVTTRRTDGIFEDRDFQFIAVGV